MSVDVIQVLASDPWRMAVLRTVRSLRLRDWAVGAGFVRNAIWDCLHGYAEPTPLSDVDVLYFDPGNTGTTREQNIEATLASRMPDVPWSVRNQARMHLRNGDRPYSSTFDAMRYWLETATCVAVTLDRRGRLSLIAPYGLEDLLAMQSAPTKRGRERRDVYVARMESKNWPSRWPRVRVNGL